MATSASASAPTTARHSPAPSSATSGSVATTDSAPTSSATMAEKLSEKAGNDDASKLKTFLSILRRFIGVSDIAAVRLSLPAQLMEPIPNLEYWNYMDRPDTFISIGDSDDELGRMLEVLRFWFTKDLKYVKGKPCKPYNSALGEFFRCTWEVEDSYPIIIGSGSKTSVVDNSDTTSKPIKLHYLTEQTCHHPPVSAYMVECPQKGIVARGYDQISAKFTGTSVKVGPGQHNEGIYITLQRRGNEEYHLTHPTAALGGLLRGSISVSVADTCFIKCEKTKIRAILHYQEEGWLGRSQNKVNGLVYRYDSGTEDITRLKEVPTMMVLARVEGSWQDKVYYTIEGEEEKQLLIDVKSLEIAPKICPPESEQLANESRRYWREVTEAIHAKQFGHATRRKQELEERQRQKVAERQKDGKPWHPRFFVAPLEPKARPELSEEGKMAIKGMEEGNYDMEERTS